VLALSPTIAPAFAGTVSLTHELLAKMSVADGCGRHYWLRRIVNINLISGRHGALHSTPAYRFQNAPRHDGVEAVGSYGCALPFGADAEATAHDQHPIISSGSTDGRPIVL
jgi:hypothetical protein